MRLSRFVTVSQSDVQVYSDRPASQCLGLTCPLRQLFDPTCLMYSPACCTPMQLS